MAELSSKTNITVPFFIPTNSHGKLTARIVIKDDYVKKDGKSSLYLQIFLNGKRKRINLNLDVDVNFFDKAKMRVRKGYPGAKDLNLVIEKTLAEVNQIEVFYRLSNIPLTIDIVEKELKNPTSRMDLLMFMEEQINIDGQFLSEATVRSSLGILKKIREFKTSIYFNELDVEMINNLLGFMKNKKKNTQNTLFNVTKYLRKYIRRAEKMGISTQITYMDIPHVKVKSEIGHLSKEELQKLWMFYKQNLPHIYKSVLAKFLFSAMTGLRISDIMALNHDSFLGDYLLKFTSKKSKKIQRIKLNSTAKSILEEGFLMEEPHSEQAVNRKLKEISSLCEIDKRLHFHMARHSFATNFLKEGGRIEVLQRLLAHSSIRDTMNYVHVVEDDMNREIFLLDNLFSDDDDLN